MKSTLENWQEKSWTQIDLKQHHAELLKKMRSYALLKYGAGEFQDAKIGRHAEKSNQPKIRSDSILWFDQLNPPAELTDLSQFLAELKNALNEKFYLGLNNMEFHFAHYSIGKHYDAHLDQFATNKAQDGVRKISLVLYLNPNWQRPDGGKLILYRNQTQEIEAEIYPEWGQMVLFESEKVLHEVEKTAAERFSFTGWFRRDQVNTI